MTSPKDEAGDTRGPSRRELLLGSLGLVATPLLGACNKDAAPVGPGETKLPKDKVPKERDMKDIDVAIIGGGPGGLAAALTLGRAGREVRVFDAGPPRNAAATHIHNFVTRDGTPPDEFRAIAREQLGLYPSVGVIDARVSAIAGEAGEFVLTTAEGEQRARRVLLCTGMVDEMLELPGFAEAWGHSIFQCPYCHGWEVKDQSWGFLATNSEGLEHGFAQLLRTWSRELTVYRIDGVEIPAPLSEVLASRGVKVETRSLRALEVEGGALRRVVLEDESRVPCEVLFAHPPQRHVSLVADLGLELDPGGYVQVDPMTRQSSKAGIYAAGDLTSRAQGAIFAASTGVHAAAMINHELAALGVYPSSVAP